MNPYKVRLGKINYINASPVYYGLDHGLLPPWLEMIPAVPAILNQRLKASSIDISPISSAFYAMNHDSLLILPDLSISCHGRVLSVLLASHYPVGELDGKRVLLSNESATAAAFIKMLFSQKKIYPDIEIRSMQEINDFYKQSDAVLIIGDAALTKPWSSFFKYVTDIGQLWHDMTNLPFVFAVWAVRKEFARTEPQLVKDTHSLLLQSKKAGESHMDTIIDAGVQKLGLGRATVRNYFAHLFCDMDDRKILAMDTFFTSLFAHNILNTRVDIQFFNTP